MYRYVNSSSNLLRMFMHVYYDLKDNLLIMYSHVFIISTWYLDETMCTGSMSSVISVMVYHHNIMVVVPSNVITDEMVIWY